MSQQEQRELAACYSGFDQLVGMSATMIDVLRMIEACSEKNEPVILLVGEPGTGKSLVAQAIHTCGSSFDTPFIKFDCAKMSESDLKNVFGAEIGIKGQQTISQQGRSSLKSGTIFIVGIGHLPPFLQSILSRQLSTFLARIKNGDNRMQWRIIVSTSRNLEELVDRRIFSAKLFSLLQTTTIFLPPLRQRRECIPALVDYFIGYYNKQHKKRIRGVRLATMTFLLQYDWPGNVRELRHAIGYAVQCEKSSLLAPAHLPANVRQQGRSSPNGKSEWITAGASWITLPSDGITLEGVERKLIEQALLRFSGNQSKAARCLGMSRDTIRYRIKKFGLEGKGRPESY